MDAVPAQGGAVPGTGDAQQSLRRLGPDNPVDRQLTPVLLPVLIHRQEYRVLPHGVQPGQGALGGGGGKPGAPAVQALPRQGAEGQPELFTVPAGCRHLPVLAHAYRLVTGGPIAVSQNGQAVCRRAEQHQPRAECVDQQHKK